MLLLDYYSSKGKESTKVNRRNEFIRACKEDFKYLVPKSIGSFAEFLLFIVFINEDTIYDYRTIFVGSNYTFGPY